MCTKHVSTSYANNTSVSTHEPMCTRHMCHVYVSKCVQHTCVHMYTYTTHMSHTLCTTHMSHTLCVQDTCGTCAYVSHVHMCHMLFHNVQGSFHSVAYAHIWHVRICVMCTVYRALFIVYRALFIVHRALFTVCGALSQCSGLFSQCGMCAYVSCAHMRTCVQDTCVTYMCPNAYNTHVSTTHMCVRICVMCAYVSHSMRVQLLRLYVWTRMCAHVCVVRA